MSVEIKYWEKESWINYLRNDVLQLYELSATILYLWKKLREIANGKLLSDVKKLVPELELMFVAGTSPPNKYEEDSLALIYKSLLGASISLREYYFLKSLNKEPKTLCRVERTSFISYIDHIHVMLERVLKKASELRLLRDSDLQTAEKKSRDISEEILKKPEKISEILVEFLNKALNLTVAYNEYTRFIWHLRKISKRYIKELYPELLKPEVFKFIQELLGLREYIIPEVDDPEIVDLYTIYSFDHAIIVDQVANVGENIIDGIKVGYVPEYLVGKFRYYSVYEPYKTIGGCLCRINELIWGLFTECRSDLRLIINDPVPNPFEEWKKAVENISKHLPKYRYTGYNYAELRYPKSYEDLSILDEWLPAIYIGKAELTMDKNRNLYLFDRW